MSTTITDTHAAVDVILRDGSDPPSAPAESTDDADAVLAFFSGLSEQSLYLRFHGIRRIGDELVEPLPGSGLGGTRRA